MHSAEGELPSSELVTLQQPCVTFKQRNGGCIQHRPPCGTTKAHLSFLINSLRLLPMFWPRRNTLRRHKEMLIKRNASGVTARYFAITSSNNIQGITKPVIRCLACRGLHLRSHLRGNLRSLEGVPQEQRGRLSCLLVSSSPGSSLCRYRQAAVQFSLQSCRLFRHC